MFYYSGNLQDGILTSWYLKFLLIGVFFSLIGSLAQTLCVANKRERIFLIANTVMTIIALTCYFFIIFLEYLKFLDKNLLSYILLSIFTIIPLVGSLISIIYIQKNLLPELVKKIVLPLWIAPVFIFILIVFNKNFILINEIIYSILSFCVMFILLILINYFMKKLIVNPK